MVKLCQNCCRFKSLLMVKLCENCCRFESHMLFELCENCRKAELPDGNIAMSELLDS